MPAPSSGPVRPPLAAPGWRGLLLRPAAKPLLFVLCLLPFLWLLQGALRDTLGPNPAEALIRGSGDWTLRALCIALAVTPLRQWSRTPALARFRRMLGLFVFFYATLHLLSYAWLDGGLEPAFIAADIAQRPFILVGFVAWLSLLLLALTSPQRLLRWLGGRRWQQLHRLIYLVALLALLHFYWMRAGKNHFGDVALYGAIIALLLGWRLWRALRR